MSRISFPVLTNRLRNDMRTPFPPQIAPHACCFRVTEPPGGCNGKGRRSGECSQMKNGGCLPPSFAMDPTDPRNHAPQPEELQVQPPQLLPVEATKVLPDFIPKTDKRRSTSALSQDGHWT